MSTVDHPQQYLLIFIYLSENGKIPDMLYQRMSQLRAFLNLTSII